MHGVGSGETDWGKIAIQWGAIIAIFWIVSSLASSDENASIDPASLPTESEALISEPATTGCAPWTGESGDCDLQSDCAPWIPDCEPDLDCEDLAGPVRVDAGDPNHLDADGDGIGCEPRP